MNLQIAVGTRVTTRNSEKKATVFFFIIIIVRLSPFNANKRNRIEITRVYERDLSSLF